MDNSFKLTRRLFKSAISTILKEKGNTYVLSESAFPAYANKNYLIDKLFWGRVYHSYNYILNNYINAKILDFGCGSGILSYLLGNKNFEVLAYDIIIDPLNMVREQISFGDNITVSDLPLEQIVESNKNMFDCIVALDVLEHIDDLLPYMEKFKHLLKENGQVIFSGPTENILYKLGRKFAGNDYSGDYHVSNINTISNFFRNYGKVEKIKTLYPVIPLFEIYSFKYFK
ncbi:MAG: class I SAM-dependent methyltransferase [Ignavibacteria bacterium]